MDPEEVRQRYARFAREEAPGRSAVYAAWAAGVAEDDRVARALADLPSPNRQPPVVFAVTRMLGAALGDYGAWAEFFLAHADRILAECASRTTQTNEPLRCAPLLFALENVPGPIALVEIGASAGLCLYPDRYVYRFRGAMTTMLGSGPVVLESDLRGDTRPPIRMPQIVWRAGIDLQPRDAADPADRGWIEGLVWPGETERQARVAAALDIVAEDPPLLVRGDASDPDTLADLVGRAPTDATLVITTPGVLPHVPRAARQALVSAIRALPARWITIDPAALQAERDPSFDAAAWDGFVLALDGRAVAAVDPLGGWIRSA